MCEDIRMGEKKKHDKELALIESVAKQCKTAIVTGPAAAKWAGLSTLNRVTKVDLVLPGEMRSWGKTYPDRVYRNTVITPQEHHLRDGVRIATGIRSVFDSFRYHGSMEALVQLESARWAKPELTHELLLELAETLPRARGSKQFRKLIRHSADTSASPLETLKRDTILRAIANGQLTGVETLEFQVGFHIKDPDGMPTTAWADALINGFIVVEADGLVKKDGTYGDAVAVTLSERHREVQLQNRGAEVVRTSWSDSDADLIKALQFQIDLHPGVRQLPNRSDETYREFLSRIQRRAS